MAWSKNGTPDTLTTSGDTLTISDLTSTKFNVVLTYLTASGQIQTGYRFGKTTIDTGSNYARRRSYQGTADSTSVSQSALNYFDAANPIFSVVYVVNISSEEKLLMGSLIGQRSAGAANAPSRDEITGKWANTRNQFDNIQNFNAQTGDYNTDSNLSALGSDMTPAAVVPATILDGLIFEETDTNKNKEYLLYHHPGTEV